MRGILAALLTLLVASQALAQAPTISSVSSPAYGIRDNGAVITFETDLYAQGVVRYGTTTGVLTDSVSRAGDPAVRIHVLDIGGLDKGTTYYYVAVAYGITGNRVSSEGSFTTRNWTTTSNIPGGTITTPYNLSTANHKYVLTGNINARATAFNITANNVVLDLGGFTVDYDTFHDIAGDLGFPNYDFEDGNTFGWTFSDESYFALNTEGTRVAEGHYHVILQNEPVPTGVTMTSSLGTAPGGVTLRLSYWASNSKFGHQYIPTRPSYKIDLLDEIDTVVATTTRDDNWIRFPITYDATAQPDKSYRARWTVDTGGSAGPARTQALDHFHLAPTGIVGIRAQGRTGVVVRNGTITQGRAKSYSSHGVWFFESSDVVAHGLTVSTNGPETQAIAFQNTGNGGAVANDLTSKSGFTQARETIQAALKVIATSNNHLFVNNSIVAGDSLAYMVTGISTDRADNSLIAYNVIDGYTQLTNHHAIILIDAEQATLANNVITVSPGQGIEISDGQAGQTNAGNRVLDNEINVLRTAPWYDTTGSHDAIRINSYGGNSYSDMLLDGNNILVRSEMVPRYRVSGGWNTTWLHANGITFHTAGADNSGNAASNNFVRAINPEGLYSYASAIEITGADSTAAIVWFGNEFESNEMVMMMTGYAGATSTKPNSVILRDNTFRKITSAPAAYNFRTLGTRPFQSGDTNIHGPIFIDNTLEGGATFAPGGDGIRWTSGPTNTLGVSGTHAAQVFLKHTLALTVKDTGGTPIVGANVQITGPKGIFNYVTGADGVVSEPLTATYIYGNTFQGTPSALTHGAYTVVVSAVGYEDAERSYPMTTAIAEDVVLNTDAIGGVLLYSTVDSAAEVQTPTEYTALFNPTSGAIYETGSGEITFEASDFGSSVRLNGTLNNDEEIRYAPGNVDVADANASGGRIDWKMKFNTNPRNEPNQFVLKVVDTTSAGYTSRWLAVETLGSPPDAYLWARMYPDLTDDYADWPQDNPELPNYDPWKNTVATNGWSYWINDVTVGVWHQYTLMWRDNGRGSSELHLLIDGQNAGCTNCSRYYATMPPTTEESSTGVGATGYLAFGGTAGHASNLDINVDEVWSFSRWDHSAGAGTYADVGIPESVILYAPADGDTVNTLTPTLEFMPTFDYFLADCQDLPTGQCRQYIYLNGVLTDSVTAVSGQYVTKALDALDYGTTYTWRVETKGGLVSSVNWGFTTLAAPEVPEAPELQNLAFTSTWNFDSRWSLGPFNEQIAYIRDQVATKHHLYIWNTETSAWDELALPTPGNVSTGVFGDFWFIRYYKDPPYPLTAWYAYVVDAGGVRSNALVDNIAQGPSFIQRGSTGIEQPPWGDDPPPNNPPVASYTWGATLLEVAFTDTSTDSDGNVVAWSWNFGDGSALSVQQNPVHTYATAGDYTVTLTVTDDDAAENSDAQVVSVTSASNVPPTANFTHTTGALAVQFTDTSTDSDGNVVAWSWNFGDGSAASTLQNPEHTYASAGDYSVTLTVTDDDAATDFITQTVTVSEGAAAEPVIQSLFFAATWSMDVRWNNGPFNEQLSYIQSQVSTKHHLYVWNTGTSNWDVVVLPTSVTTGVSGDFWYIRYYQDNLYTNPAWYAFIADAGAVRSNSLVDNLAQGPVFHQHGATGIEQPPWGGDPPPNSPPTAGFTWITNYLEATFTDTSTDSDGNIVGWNWNFGDGVGTSSLQNPVYTYGTNGPYNVTLTVTDDDGATDDIIQSVSVSLPPPVASFTWNATNLQVNFDASGSTGDLTVWAWNFGNENGGLGVTQSETYASAGQYTVTLIVTQSDAQSDQDVQVITVSEAPVTLSADFEWTTTFLEAQFTDLSVPSTGATITAWFWTFGDGSPSSSEQSPTKIYTESGTYTVGLLLGDSNQNDDFIQYQVEVVGIDIPSIAPSITSRSRSLQDIRAGSNWYDTAEGGLNPGADANMLSEQDKIDLANAGLGYLIMNRGLTTTGQTRLAEIAAHNPDFRWVAYQWLNHVSATNPAGLSIPIQSWEHNNIPLALDTLGEPIVAWYVGGGSSGDPLLYTANLVFPNTGGANFNKDLIDDWIEMILGYMDAAAIPPIGMKLDYFTSEGYGPPHYHGDEAIDLNQNGIEYSIDAAEKAGHLASQEYIAQRFRELLGPDFVIIANGAATYTDTESTTDLRLLLNGAIIEGWPNTVHGNSPTTAWNRAFTAFTANPIEFDSFRGKSWHFMAYGRADWVFSGMAESSSKTVNAHRLGALMFDGWHKVEVASAINVYNNAEIVDPQYDAWRALLGEPTGPVERTGLTTEPHSYSRVFQGGVAVVEIDPAGSGLNQIVAAYIDSLPVGPSARRMGGRGLDKGGKPSKGVPGLSKQ